MTTPEERLRELLRHEVATITPAGDGLAKIQQRLVRRRRRRTLLVPAAALATAGATAAFFLLGGTDDRHTLVQQPGGQSPSPAAPTPKPSVTPGRIVPGDYTGPAVWPFTSHAQARAWTPGGSYPWAQDSLEVTKHFVSDHLQLTGLTAVQTCVSCEVVELRTAAGRKAAEVALAHFTTARGNRVFSVVSVDGGDLTVTHPAAGAAITSPTSVSGRITGVDENVLLRLVTPDGTKIAESGAPAGSAVPWQGTLTWSDTSWTSAAIVGTTASAKDGTLNRLVVLPVSRATGASTSSSFVGLVDGHVSLFDATTGKVVKQLTYPPAGKVDTGATWAGGSLSWVRSRQTGCADELVRLDHGAATTVVQAGTAHLGTPQLSPSAGWLAWLQTPCNGDAASIVVSGGGAPNRTLTVPSGTAAVVLDVRDGGALLVHLNDAAGTDAGTLGVVPAGALNLHGVRPLTPAPGCYLAGGAAFDGSTPVAFETCRADSRLVRFTDRGARASTGPTVSSMAAPRSITTHAGQVLVWLKDGTVARYADGRLTRLPTNGVRAPDW
ncbi:MAG: hypothetical protein JWM02_3227 [Frankiales bacterium]|nr:hypothetical protein [Frankiales bacterium]